MFEDLSGHHTTGEHGTSATNTKSGVAPSFLTVPNVSNQVPHELHHLADSELFAARMKLFRESGLLHDVCLSEAHGIFELNALADEQLANAVNIQNLCADLNLNIMLGSDVMDSSCYNSGGNNDGKDVLFEISINLNLNRGHNVRYLKDRVLQLEQACPGMQNFIAHTFKNMNAVPWILDPFAVQEMYSAYIFDWHLDADSELDDGEKSEDFPASSFHPNILKSIPNVWRSKSICRYWEKDLGLTLLDAIKNRPQAVHHQTNPALEQIRLLGNAIARDNPRLARTLKKYPDCRAFDSSNWLMVVAYEPSDFIQQHADHIYEDMGNSGEAQEVGLALNVSKCPKKFIELLNDLKFILIYVDRCLHFSDLVTTE